MLIVSKSLSSCFWGQNMKFSMNTFTCIIYCDGRPGCLIITVCKYTMLILITRTFVLVHFSSETKRKLYICIETFLCFLHTSDWAYVSWAWCILGLFLFLAVLALHDTNVAIYMQVCCISHRVNGSNF